MTCKGTNRAAASARRRASSKSGISLSLASYGIDRAADVFGGIAKAGTGGEEGADFASFGFVENAGSSGHDWELGVRGWGLETMLVFSRRGVGMQLLFLARGIALKGKVESEKGKLLFSAFRFRLSALVRVAKKCGLTGELVLKRARD